MSQTEIFNAAVRLSPDERAAFLERACGANRELRDEVESLLQAHDAPDSFLREPVERTGAYEPLAERAGAVIGPYKLLEQIGEGGFGVVFMAEQTHPVRRKVALKILKPGMDTRQVVARFEAERQALALMDHPNIAKVFDGGATPSVRPYFVMELVKGVPITDFCDQNHLTPRQRLELFISVCQAVQHAHQKGIIHRDIKPSNVLVTVHDTTPVVKVIDFGVAKALGQELTERTLFTAFAQMIGTPLYMSPEQAGQSGLDVDTRSDIYSLGVLLYELLTGTTPFDKERFRKAAYDEIRRIIREEEPPRPSTRLSELGRSGDSTRTGAAGSPSSLASVSASRHTEPAKLTRLFRGEVDWIVMKALEKDRGRRYETANAFAADVQRYLADEPVQACPPSASYRFRKFARRNKQALAGAAVLGVAVLAVAGTLGWAFRDREARAHDAARDRAAREARAAQESADRQVRIAARVDQLLADADALAREEKWEEALAAARRAEAVLASGDAAPDTAERVRRAVAGLELVRRLEEIQARTGTVWDPVPVAQAVQTDRDYAAEFHAAGLDVDAATVAEAAAWLAARPGIRAALLAALDDWTHSRVEARGEAAARRLTDIAQAADSDPWRKQLREAVLRKHVPLLERLAASPELDRQPASSVYLLTNALRGAGKSTIEVLRRAQTRHPADYWINHRLGVHLIFRMTPDQVRDGIGFMRAAVALRPKSGHSIMNLGNGYRHLGQDDQALACFRKAIELDPSRANAHMNLGLVLRKQGKLEEAVVSCQRAIGLDPKNAPAHYNLGLALHDQKKRDGAVACYRKAIELDPKYWAAHFTLGLALRKQGKLDESVASFRKAIEIHPKYAPAHHNLGLALHDQKKLEEAIAAYHKAIEIDPKVALAHYNLGRGLHDLKKLDEAVASYLKAIELDPKDAASHNNLGNVLYDQKKPDEAIDCYRKAIEADPKYAPAHYNLGLALGDQKKPDEAIACYRTAIELDPKLVLAHTNLGNVLMEKGRPDEAIACYRKAIELDPKDAVAHNNLGNALADQKKPEEAVASYRKAIELDPKDANPHNGLGNALKAQGKLDEAVAEYRKAIELDPKFAAWHYNLGYALLDQKKPDEAVVHFKKAIELDPKEAKAHIGLGIALTDKGQIDGAIAAHRKAIEIDPRDARAHFNLGCALMRQERLDEAIASFRKVIELDPKNAAAHCNLGGALVEKRRFDEAIASCRKAIELDPKDAAAAHYNLGCAFRGKRQYDEAIASYRKAIELDPKDAKSHHNLGEALWGTGHPAEAVDCLRKAIDLDPKAAGSHKLLGQIFLSLRQEDEAIASFRKAIELDPSHTAAHHNLGSILQARGEVDLALTHYRKAAEKLEPPTNKAMPYAYLAGGYRSQGKWDEAVASYKKAIELDPKNASFHSGLGSVLQSQGKMAEAIACYRRAVELAPKLAGPHNTLAWALATCADPKLRDPAGALRHAETAVELAPKAGFCWQTLAWARYRTGDWKGAVAAMTKVKELGSKGDSREWFLLAMAHWKLGDKCEAHRCYDKGVEWTDKHQPENEELRRFRAEVSELLGVAVEVAPAPRPKK